MFESRSHLCILALATAIALQPGAALAQAVDEPGNNVSRALQQPFRDLNIVRPRTDAVLTLALVNPYDNSGLDDCTAVGSRIDELASVLGPDIVGTRKSENNAASELAGGAINGVIGIPFSGVVRHLTGAYAEDMAHRRAVLAGMVRRGYLNGIWQTMGCDSAKVADWQSTLPVLPPPMIAPAEASAPDSAAG